MFSNAAQNSKQTGSNHPYAHKEKESILPSSYDIDRLIAMPKDPQWLFCYWDFTEKTRKKIANYIDDVFMLRVRLDQREILKVPVERFAKSWYLKVDSPGASLIVDYGVQTANGYRAFLTSNSVHMPPQTVSQKVDSMWLYYDELYKKDYFQQTGTSPLFWQKELKIPAQYISSPMPKEAPTEKEHYLWADTDLVIYGKTAPGSILLQNQQPIELDQEGNFQMRIKLNTGTQNIDLTSFAKNGLSETKTIRVERS